MDTVWTVPEKLKHLSAAYSDKPAFVCVNPKGGKTVLTSKDVYNFSGRFAFHLRQEGIQSQDIVCNTIPNCPEKIITDFGTMMAGAALVGREAVYANGEDLIHVINLAQCKAIVVNPHQPNGPWEILQKHFEKVDGSNVTSLVMPSLKVVIYCERHGNPTAVEFSFWESLRAQNGFLHEHVKANDIALLITTSGTTGLPKLVCYSHFALFNAGKDMASASLAKDEDIYYNDRPLGWLGGFPFLYLCVGSTRVLLDRWEGMLTDYTTVMWSALCQECSTIALIAPFHVDQIVKNKKLWEAAQWKLKTMLTGGQPVNTPTCNAIGLLTEKIIVVYALTEMGLPASYLVTAKSGFTEHMCGKPTPGYSVKIVNNDLKEVPAGTYGEILIKRQFPFSGYLNDEETTKKSMDHEWFRTKDIGFCGIDGNLVVEGRIDDAIMKGACILYPASLEMKILAHPAIQRVAVIAVKDKVLFHEVCACINLEPGCSMSEGKIRKYCQDFLSEKDDERFLIPKYYLFLKTFPETGSGKVDRKKLRKIAEEMLQL